MISTKRAAGIEGDNHMDTNRQAATIKERTMKPTATNLIRWAGLSAMVAGICFVLVGLFHQLNILSSVTTTQWVIVHVLAMAMCFFGLFGITGIYARQVEETGWLGLAGYLMLSLWLAVILGFTFVEVLILPLLATEAPAFAEAFLGAVTGSASETNVGALPMTWNLAAPLLPLGGLLFGIATFRARILPRWATGLLAVGCLLAPMAALVPTEHQPKVMVPIGLALAWMGYALWTERRAHAAEPVPGRESPQLRPIEAT
jgi:hypothetical protein